MIVDKNYDEEHQILGWLIHDYAVSYSIRNTEFGSYQVFFECIVSIDTPPNEITESDITNTLENLLVVREDCALTVESYRYIKTRQKEV